MSEQRQQRLKIRKREKRAVERLVGRSDLRDALTDAQAQALLDWAIAQVKMTARETAVLPDPEAETVLEQKVTAVAESMRLLNRIVARPAGGNEPEAIEQVERFLDALARVKGHPPTATAAEVATAVQQPFANSFDLLMQLINPQEEEE